MGEHRTLGVFCPVLQEETVISGGSIQDSRNWPATPITAYAGPSLVTPGCPTLQQVSISGDFEAVLSFGIGLE